MPADVQSSTIQWDDLSEICDLFAVPLKLLPGPQKDRGPQLRTTGPAEGSDFLKIAASSGADLSNRSPAEVVLLQRA